MPQKLQTDFKHVEEISNDINRQLIYENLLKLTKLFIIFLKIQSKLLNRLLILLVFF